MDNKLTVKEALEQGYVYFGKDNGEFQFVHRIECISEADFEDGPQLLAEKESYYSPSISPEEIAETLADVIWNQCGDETGDDTDDVYDIVKSLDFSAAANLINEALKGKKYYKLTNIQLIPTDNGTTERNAGTHKG